MICASPFAIGGRSSRTTYCDKDILSTMRSDYEMENTKNSSLDFFTDSLNLTGFTPLTFARIFSVCQSDLTVRQ